MKKVYYLKNCGTCKKIMAQYDLSDWELRELKTQPITEEELKEMHQLSHSYESLFSKRSTQIKARGIEVSKLDEEGFKNLILDHYSFLKRPVFITDNQIMIGSDKKNLEVLENFFKK
ncbi:arsenate reductase family protein [Elizabethkingia sp. JS20170427COW]|uniref:arsenate reductase family protein n=1 Tax=Elizabethkingia sp. JS20170427COW TaxID=2583851 RepID=UPI001110D60C|nr:ArsC/Spx/MgsR family protein [Elizabethkingia sp. JS20170427COW]QCX53834.1 arsenate reductase family protein [Elizabethkingia sp. JS20170427COW]